jgi:Mn2+/Fe2+ NRAMP family transporter
LSGPGTSRPTLGFLRVLGPGLAIAATGVGAGDLLAAMLAGANFAHALVWVVVVGAVLKLVLNEGVARWQLATDTTILEGWCRHLGRPFQIYFLVYLVVWSFIVAGGLMSACGVAAHALAPGLEIRTWAIVHSLAALALVLIGRYALFETVMKILIGVMVLTLLISVVLVGPDLMGAIRGLIPAMPKGSAAATLSLMGGVGGSVTMLSYGYWIQEKGWKGTSELGKVRLDLTVGYVLTGLFGIAMLMLAAVVLGGGAGMPPGSEGLVACGDAIRESTTERFGAGVGNTTALIFLIGVWGAIFTSTLGVWNGVPYLFADFVDAFRGRYGEIPSTGSWTYRGYLLFLALPPMAMLFLDRPIWVITVYTVTGGLFMPLLAGSLLWLNSRKTLVGEQRNGAWTTAMLVLALLLFAGIAVRQFIDLL